MIRSRLARGAATLAGVCVILVGSLNVAPATASDPTGVSSTTTTVTPTGEAFYSPPVPLPTGKPGALIRAELIVAPAGATAWRVLSHTTSLSGQDTALSGVVIAPNGPAPKGGRPIVAWAHGTTGLADQCAPSKAADAANRIPFVNELLAAGYVVAATDYQGLGTPGVHPYLVGESEGRAVLDTARVARQLPTDAGKRVLIAGHSQGGHAALFASEIAPKYAPDLKVLGTAAGAPVTDVQQFLDLAVKSPFNTGFMVMGAQGYVVAYPELAKTPLLSGSIAARSSVAIEGCAADALMAFAGDSGETVFATDLNQVAMWREKMQDNSTGNRRARAPVMVWQGAADTLTPSALVAPYVPKACAKGSVVEYREYADANHGSVLDAAKNDVLAFFAARLAGETPKSTCK